VTSAAKVHEEIEALRRQLHQGLGSSYDPARLQALVPISQKLDRLAVEVVREEYINRHKDSHS